MGWIWSLQSLLPGFTLFSLNFFQNCHRFSFGRKLLKNLSVHGLLFMVHASWFMLHGSWFITQKFRRSRSCRGFLWTCWPRTSSPPKMSCLLSGTLTRWYLQLIQTSFWIFGILFHLVNVRWPLFCPLFGQDIPLRQWKPWTLCMIQFSHKISWRNREMT